jgi:valyl-tRNA synthetase
MGDREEGILCGKGTPDEFRTSGLAQVAIDATMGAPGNPSGRALDFHPARYQSGYVAWLAEKRDWCISRQLWWGHRIPVWTARSEGGADLSEILRRLPEDAAEQMCVWVSDTTGRQMETAEARDLVEGGYEPLEVQVCLRNEEAESRYAALLEELGLEQDPDVLDTWFSSALWPFSTLGWPDPKNAAIGEGQTPLGGPGGRDAFSYYYPGSCLVTGRDIITLWVARMMIMGLYTHGDVPFTDTFIHAKILDGNGVTMSKSKGNGIDPSDIVERYGADAMRYLVCDIETGMQDVRLPVQATCPTCQTVVELAQAEHGKTIFTYMCPSCRSEFDVLGTMPGVPATKVFSDRFEQGRNFCNKLWNAARFALMNLEGYRYRPLGGEDLAPEDRWILSRLSRAVGEVTASLSAYRPSAALGAAREFFWGEFCDWYLEIIKRRMQEPAQAAVARQVLAAAMDQILRLLHPFVPFITEQLWEYLNERAPRRGLEADLSSSELCVLADWPAPRRERENETLEAEFEAVKATISSIRELRSRYSVGPSKELPCAIRAEGSALATLERHRELVVFMAHLSDLEMGPDVARPQNSAAQVVGEVEVFLGGVLDPEKERERLETQIARVTKQLESSRKNLANEKFVGRAPAQVVEAERNKAADLESQLALLNQNLEALSPS